MVGVKIPRVGVKITRVSLTPGGQAAQGVKINCYTGMTEKLFTETLSKKKTKRKNSWLMRVKLCDWGTPKWSWSV